MFHEPLKGKTYVSIFQNTICSSLSNTPSQQHLGPHRKLGRQADAAGGAEAGRAARRQAAAALR